MLEAEYSERHLNMKSMSSAFVRQLLQLFAHRSSIKALHHHALLHAKVCKQRGELSEKVEWKLVTQRHFNWIGMDGRLSDSNREEHEHKSRVAVVAGKHAYQSEQ